MALKDIVKGICDITRCKYDVYTKEKTDELLEEERKYVNELVASQIIQLEADEQTVSNVPETLRFTKQKATVGSELIHDSANFGVKIGKGITKIKISGAINLGAYEVNQTPLVRVCKNSESLMQYGISCPEMWANDMISIPCFIIDVEENDVITVQVTGNTNNVLVRTGAYITVEKVA